MGYAYGMQLTPPPPAIAEAGLRALLTVARTQKPVEAMAMKYVEAVQKHILHTSFALHALAPISPQALASAVPDAAFRKRIVGGCVLMALITGHGVAEKEKIVKEFANALQIDDENIRVLKHAVRGRYTQIRMDLLRRFTAADRIKREFRQYGIRAVGHIVRAMMAMRGNKKMAARYQALLQLPEGTLGHAYVTFIRANGFSLPGEPGSPPEMIIVHDCIHVLAEYGTSVEEETKIAAFQGGMHRDDMFGMLLFTLLQFQLGHQIVNTAPSFEQKIQPDAWLAAYARGTQLKTDLIATWEPKADFSTPVQVLRERFGIPPRQ